MLHYAMVYCNTFYLLLITYVFIKIKIWGFCLFLYLLENKKSRLAGWFIKATEIYKNYLERLNFLDETA